MDPRRRFLNSLKPWGAAGLVRLAGLWGSLALHLAAGALVLGLSRPGGVAGGGEASVILVVLAEAGGEAEGSAEPKGSAEPEGSAEPAGSEAQGAQAEGPLEPANLGKRKAPKAPPPKDNPAKAAGSGRAGSGHAGQAGASSIGAGEGGSSAYARGNYEYIKKRVRQRLVYNPQAKRLGLQGTATVSFTIVQSGGARDIAVVKSSGHGALDESALNAVRAAAPFPPPPAPARIVLPISFSLK